MEELSKDDFEEKTKTGKTIIDFWAPWCGPCQVLGPNFEAASKEHKDVGFFKVNVDEEASLAGHFGVRSIPTIILLKDGEEVERLVGAMSKEKLSERINIVFA